MKKSLDIAGLWAAAEILWKAGIKRQRKKNWKILRNIKISKTCLEEEKRK